jgi:hypothetical protein
MRVLEGVLRLFAGMVIVARPLLYVAARTIQPPEIDRGTRTAPLENGVTRSMT